MNLLAINRIDQTKFDISFNTRELPTGELDVGMAIRLNCIISVKLKDLNYYGLPMGLMVLLTKIKKQKTEGRFCESKDKSYNI